MKKITNFVLILGVLGIMNFVPMLASAQSGLVPCGTEKTKIEPVLDAAGKPTGAETGGEIINPCKFEHLFVLINGLIDFIFMYLVVPIAAIMFAYAGFLMLFSGGNASKSEKAKGIFMNVFIGLVIAAAAWLIINTVLNIVGFNGTAFGLEKKQ